MRRLCLKIFLVLLVSLYCTLNVYSLDNSTKIKPLKIVIVRSYNFNHICGSPQVSGFLDTIYQYGRSNKRLKNVHVVSFYLNTKDKNTTEDLKYAVTNLVLREIRKIKPDIIYTTDDNSFKYLVLEHKLYKKYTIFYSGINKRFYEYTKEYPEILKYSNKSLIGIEEFIKLNKVVNLIKCEGWDRKTIAILVDHTPTSQYLLNDWEDFLSRKRISATVIHISETKDLKNILSRKYNFIIVTLQSIRDTKTGDILKKKDILKYIAKNEEGKTVVITTNLKSIDYGPDIVAGVSFYEMGVLAAEDLIAYIQREDSSDATFVCNNSMLSSFVIVNLDKLHNKHKDIDHKCLKYITDFK